MADLTIPQGTTGQNYFGFFNNSYSFGQSFLAPTTSLESVKLTLDIGGYWSWYGQVASAQDVQYRVFVRDMVTNEVLFTSDVQTLKAIPGESGNYGAIHEFRDVEVALGNTAVTLGHQYAIMVNILNTDMYVETSANSNNPYAGGEFFYVYKYNDYEYKYSVSNWDMTMTLNGGVSNTAPVAVKDMAYASEDGGAVTIAVLANDTDADSLDTKTLVSVNTAGTVGSATANADGTVTYNPGTNFQSMAPWQSTTDTFSYTMKDKAGAESTATVTVKVQGKNDAPVAVADTFKAVENGGPVMLTILHNDTEIDNGDFLMVKTIDTTATKGIVTDKGVVVDYEAGDAFNYLAAGAIGKDTFTYTATDVEGATSTATVTVYVTGVNDAPIAKNDSAAVAEDASVTIDVLANDFDIDAGDTMAIVSASTASGASVAIVDGKLVYTADADAQDLLVEGGSSADTITYVMADQAGVQSSATVAVTVKGVANGASIQGTVKSDTLKGTSLDEIISGGNGEDVLSGLDGADALFGGNGKDSLFGGAGIDILQGDEGNDMLNGGTGNDALSGGLGSDLFVFELNFGHDFIVDFKPQNDTIQIARSLLGDFAAVTSHATQVGADVVIAVDANNTITIAGVNLADLSAKDFIFG